jgi:hypothetical protein
VKRGWASRVADWIWVTGIEPEFPEEFLREMYRTYVREGWIEDLKELIELSGVEPSEAYRTLLEQLLD